MLFSVVISVVGCVVVTISDIDDGAGGTLRTACTYIMVERMKMVSMHHTKSLSLSAEVVASC